MAALRKEIRLTIPPHQIAFFGTTTAIWAATAMPATRVLVGPCVLRAYCAVAPPTTPYDIAWFLLYPVVLMAQGGFEGFHAGVGSESSSLRQVAHGIPSVKPKDDWTDDRQTCIPRDGIP
jgi:hypothetical protein